MGRGYGLVLRFCHDLRVRQFMLQTLEGCGGYIASVEGEKLELVERIEIWKTLVGYVSIRQDETLQLRVRFQMCEGYVGYGR